MEPPPAAVAAAAAAVAAEAAAAAVQESLLREKLGGLKLGEAGDGDAMDSYPPQSRATV
jgi:hypothetical protein